MNVHDWDFEAYCEEQRSGFDAMRDSVAELGVPRPWLVDRLERSLVEGLRWLDSLDRQHPFWIATNQLPTTTKLGRRLEQLMQGGASDARFVEYDFALALHVSRGALAHHAFWSAQPALPIEWQIEVAWIESMHCGSDSGIVEAVRRLGRSGELRESLLRLRSASALLPPWRSGLLARLATS